MTLDELIWNTFTEEERDTATSGECGTWALVVYRALKAIGKTADLVLICEADDTGKPYEFHPGEIAWRHCALELDGKFYDVHGHVEIEDLKVNYVWGNGREAAHVVLDEAAFQYQISCSHDLASDYFYKIWSEKIKDALTHWRCLLL